ncbi:HAD family phosphatase [bacterium]|nr:MAG: HAD family phosphatase [bacterium]
MLRAVVFDVEGTLLDSIEHRALAWRDALREFGPVIEPESLVPYVAGSEREIPRRFLEPAILAEVTTERVIERYRDHWENVHGPRVEALPHGKELVEELRRRGLQVVLATRAHDNRIKDVVARAGLTGIVDASGEPDGSERDVLAAAQALTEANPNETLAVVHGASDAKAARALGMRLVGLLSGGGNADHLEQEGCERIFASAAEMFSNIDDLTPLGLPTASHEAPASTKTYMA